MLYKYSLFLYQLLRKIRYTLLVTVFGFTIHCRHAPTCGTRLLHIIEKKKYNQLPSMMWQVLTCF